MEQTQFHTGTRASVAGVGAQTNGRITTIAPITDSMVKPVSQMNLEEIMGLLAAKQTDARKRTVEKRNYLRLQPEDITDCPDARMFRVLNAHLECMDAWGNDITDSEFNGWLAKIRKATQEMKAELGQIGPDAVSQAVSMLVRPSEKNSIHHILRGHISPAIYRTAPTMAGWA